MAILSSPLSSLRPHYDVIVIGSGYGGSIAASRLARSTKADGSEVKVCLLERGKEIPTGEYPDDVDSAALEFQVESQLGHVGDRNALYHMRYNDDISVFQGCGLGGTSLVNANVSLEADSRVFSASRGWPQPLLDDLGSGLASGFQRAREMLRPETYPEHFPELKKRRSLLDSAAELGGADKCRLSPINVSFKDGINHVGVEQPACNGCGDCISGCNVGAKGTLLKNYLPDARNNGAEIFCSVDVRHVLHSNGRYTVYYSPVGARRKAFEAPDLFVTADLVIISAGALGSNEIMLRSKAAGLPSSDRIGYRFTGNGDVLAFGYNMDQSVNGIGAGKETVDENQPCGPCITSVIDLRDTDNLEKGMIIEEGSLPGALGPFLPATFKTAAALTGTDTDEGMMDRMREISREWESVVRGPYHGAVHNTQTFLVMSHDDCGGRVVLDDDRARLMWPGVGQQDIFQDVEENLIKATSTWGGTYVPNPTFTKAFNYDLITVHPLGGCAMAEDATTGVVDHTGRVFSGVTGDSVHSGLYLSDGSILPCSLGVNPLLTICAIAERNMALLAEDRGWTIEYTLSNEPARYDGTRANAGDYSLQFTEKMAGYASTEVLDEYHAAEVLAKTNDQRASFVLTILTEDLDGMLDDPQHAATLYGSVYIPALSSKPMSTSGGHFNLFSPAGENVKHMRYRMELHSEEGKHYYFEGYKVIRDDAGADVWADTTTLYIDVYEGRDASGSLRAKGVLKIAPDDFSRQMTTIQASKIGEGLSISAVARFGQFFAGALWDTYGAI